jgi:hypothetical protein
MHLKLYATHQLKCQHDIQVHGACHAVFPITIRKKTCVISTLMISGKNEKPWVTWPWTHLASPPFLPQRKEWCLASCATEIPLQSDESTALKSQQNRLGSPFQSLSFFPIWTFCIAARRTFEKTVRHRHIMTYHTSWSSDSSICQISYGSWLNLHWSSYILILGGYAATPPTIKYG